MPSRKRLSRMKSNSLAQYFLNEGMMSLEQMEPMLSKMRNREIQLPVIALRQRMVDPCVLDEMHASGGKDFAKEAVEKNLLTSAQVEQLRQETGGESLHFAQYLLDEDILTYAELDVYFREREHMKELPVHYAVRRLCGERLAKERAVYSDFMEIFMDSLMDFLHTPAVISLEPVSEIEFTSGFATHAASQHMNGDVSIVTGILAEDAEFLELAGRYSEEDLTEIDEIAIDSIQEYLNVINGIFSIQLAERSIDVELEVPRWGAVVIPQGHRQLIMRVCTDFGMIYVIVSSDEFIGQT